MFWDALPKEPQQWNVKVNSSKSQEPRGDRAISMFMSLKNGGRMSGPSWITHPTTIPKTHSEFTVYKNDDWKIMAGGLL